MLVLRVSVLLIIFFQFEVSSFAHNYQKQSKIELNNIWFEMQKCPSLTRSILEHNNGLRELNNKEILSILNSLSVSPLGGTYSLILKKLQDKSQKMKIKFFTVKDSSIATSAEFYEGGLIYIKESSFKNILLFEKNNFKILTSQTLIDLSFVLHELTHAFSYFLNVLDLFPSYDPQAKINEILAYYSQGFFIKELDHRGFKLMESSKISSWDKCVGILSDILEKIGITPETPPPLAVNALMDLQLDATEEQKISAQPFINLTYLYENYFIKNLENWNAIRQKQTPIQAVTYLTKMVTKDVDSWSCNLKTSFTYMEEKIPLYSSLFNLPENTNGCGYISEYANGLLKFVALDRKTYYDILFWLTKNNLLNLINPTNKIK